MKHIKLLASTALCFFLMVSISNQVEASKSSDATDSIEKMIDPKIKKTRKCTLADGRTGRIEDCFSASTGTCWLPDVRECYSRD